MTRLRKRRAFGVLFLLLGVSLALFLVLYALRQNINLFYTPSQVISGDAPKHHLFRIGGLVKKNSIHHSSEDLKVNFILTDNQREVKIFYQGILPDLFHENRGAIVEGQLNDKGIFIAERVLAKHGEKYMPLEIQNSLKRKNT